MKSKLQELQGVWNVVAVEIEGRSMPAGGAQIVVKDDYFTSMGIGATYEGKFVLDVSSSPFAIDMNFTAGPEKGNTNRGIFELAGDTWRLCLNMTGGQRPSDFTTGPNSGLALETLQRTKARARIKTTKTLQPAEPLASDFPTEPVPELEGEWAMVSCAYDGEQLEPSFVSSCRRIAKGNETATIMGKQLLIKARFSVDRSRQPNTIDYLLTAGPGAGQKQFGIFELKGGKLTVSFSHPGMPRPADFSFTRGDGHTVTAWRRIKN
jgi:uncharacterized protein (TIGR03067 family)